MCPAQPEPARPGLPSDSKERASRVGATQLHLDSGSFSKRDRNPSMRGGPSSTNSCCARPRREAGSACSGVGSDSHEDSQGVAPGRSSNRCGESASVGSARSSMPVRNRPGRSNSPGARSFFRNAADQIESSPRPQHLAASSLLPPVPYLLPFIDSNPRRPTLRPNPRPSSKQSTGSLALQSGRTLRPWPRRTRALYAVLVLCNPWLPLRVVLAPLRAGRRPRRGIRVDLHRGLLRHRVNRPQNPAARALPRETLGAAARDLGRQPEVGRALFFGEVIGHARSFALRRAIRPCASGALAAP